jgi:signal transduction histidine kinase
MNREKTNKDRNPGESGLFRLPAAVIDNMKRMLRFSIRTNISATYLILFSVFFVLLVGLLLLGYVQTTRQAIWQEYGEIMEAIRSEVESENWDTTLQETLDRIYKEDKIGILVVNHTNGQKISNALDYPIWNYDKIADGRLLEAESEVFSLLPYQLIAFEEDAGANRSVVFFFSVANQIYVARTLSVYLLGGYLIGALLLWFAGGRKVKQIIRPIDRIAQATKSINTKNLGARIDVGQAKYELKDLASTINDMMDRMQDGYRKQQQFVSDVSHELRTPISVINGYANLLDRWGKEDPVILQEAIDALKNESQNMGDLVEKLLFLARYDRDALKYDMQPIDFSELMDEVGKETEMIDDQHHIVWSVEEQLRILGDANRIKQVARIFVDNAVKYSPPGGEILIRGYREDPYVVLEVEDRGMGISKDQLQPIFERFYRTDESRSKHTGGYGLGLSIAKIIVLQHDGKIRVRSKPGAGSIFAALLPILPTKEKEKR